MKTITIEGKFTDSVNNSVTVEVYRPNSIPSPYDLLKRYNTDFTEAITDLEDDLKYHIDFNGYTTGNFELKISGEFTDPNPIEESFSGGAFTPGYRIHTN